MFIVEEQVLKTLRASEQDHFWMKLALALAQAAQFREEVPVGAVIVCNNQLIASGFNQREQSQNPINHAEIIAIQKAAHYRGSWRLSDYELYVTLEPCVMCAGAISQARMKRVIYGTRDPKGGACGSIYHLQSDQRLNHRFPITEGVLHRQCSDLLRQFFQKQRQESQHQTIPQK